MSTQFNEDWFAEGDIIPAVIEAEKRVREELEPKIDRLTADNKRLTEENSRLKDFKTLNESNIERLTNNYVAERQKNVSLEQQLKTNTEFYTNQLHTRGQSINTLEAEKKSLTEQMQDLKAKIVSLEQQTQQVRAALLTAQNQIGSSNITIDSLKRDLKKESELKAQSYQAGVDYAKSQEKARQQSRAKQ